jgi:hypothetical protein
MGFNEFISKLFGNKASHEGNSAVGEQGKRSVS